ncbi:MAG: NAD(P)H-hydrate epimerase [Nitrososphaerales archaeon]
MILQNGLAYLTSEEMGEADREAINGFGIDVLSLMENAGTAVAALTRVLLKGSVAERRIGVLVGKGNNGGDGLVAARHLHDWRADVRVVLSDRESLGQVPSRQLTAVEKAGVPIHGTGGALADCDLLIDSLLGYNSKGNPRGPVRDVILNANASGVPILAVDIPSGLDATTGEPNDPCVTARATLTLGFPKTGFLDPRCRPYVGRLYLGDVSLPLEVYRKHSQSATIFEKESVVRIW